MSVVSMVSEVPAVSMVPEVPAVSMVSVVSEVSMVSKVPALFMVSEVPTVSMVPEVSTVSEVSLGSVYVTLHGQQDTQTPELQCVWMCVRAETEESLSQLPAFQHQWVHNAHAYKLSEIAEVDSTAVCTAECS